MKWPYKPCSVYYFTRSLSGSHVVNGFRCLRIRRDNNPFSDNAFIHINDFPFTMRVLITDMAGDIISDTNY